VPIYEYERADGTRFETRQGFHDDALSVCPDTGQAVRRLVSAAPIIFKGSGWYITDSRPSSSKSDSVSDSSSSGSSDSKPAAETKSDAPAATDAKGGASTAAKSGDAGAKKGAAAA
jgi:putative FmdB family regulatory protein